MKISTIIEQDDRARVKARKIVDMIEEEAKTLNDIDAIGMYAFIQGALDVMIKNEGF